MASYPLTHATWPACILLLFGCVDSEQSYFPLQEGMQWTYQTTKTIRGETQQQKYIFIGLPNGKLNNEPASIRKSMDGTFLYYREVEDGVLFIGRQKPPGVFDRVEQYVFRYPLEQDVQWRGITTTQLLIRIGPPINEEIEFSTEIPILARIESTDDTVDVPAGTYANCIKIVKRGSKNVEVKDYKGVSVRNTVVKVHEISWYALGVGLVKLVRKETSGSHTLDQGGIVIELESVDT